MHACKEPHKACAASLVHFIDTGIGQYLSEHMAHLVLQDEVHGVAVQFRVAGKANAPFWFTEPPVTTLPGAFATGSGSPVIIDSST